MHEAPAAKVVPQRFSALKATPRTIGVEIATAAEPRFVNLICCGGDTVPGPRVPKSAVSGQAAKGAAGPAIWLTLPRNAARSSTSASLSSDLRKPIAPTFVSAFCKANGALAALRMLLRPAAGSGP